uniref:Beta-N-acetylhexosaminidase n=1 Tax=Rhabditophanes sp. KR3021 TaxID=114890 RepID=A0AC35UEM0_9BILA
MSTAFKTFREGEKIVHLDLKGAPPKLIFYRQFFPFLNALGVTGILMEYEDMFPYTGILKSVSKVYSYTDQEINQLTELAEQNDLEIIPLVQTFGHMEFVLKHNMFWHLKEVPTKDDSICPTDRESQALIEEMITQIKKLHPKSRRIHIGADEAYQVNKCGRCRYIKRENNNIILEHISKIASIALTKCGFSEVLAWYDMFEKATIKNLREYNFHELIVPVIWGYKEDVTQDNYFPRGLLEKFSLVFDKVYFAGAYKGAMKQDSQLIDNNRYLNNLKSYVKYFKQNEECFKNSQMVLSGTILTGWSRFSHHQSLCELLPAAMFSLVQELVYLQDVNQNVDVKISQRTRDIMTSFPGSDLFYLIEELREIYTDVEANGYKSDNGRLQEIKGRIEVVFKKYFYEDTLFEWQMKNCPNVQQFSGYMSRISRRVKMLKSMF